MLEAGLSSTRTSIDAHTQTKINAFCVERRYVSASTIRCPFTISSLGVENIAGAAQERNASVFAQLLSTKYLRGAENYGDFQGILTSEIKQKMRDVFTKMQEWGNEGKMPDFPHDCGMVDTYDAGMLRWQP